MDGTPLRLIDLSALLSVTEGAQDNTDAQYRQFRAGAIPLLGLALLYLAAARWHALYYAHRPRIQARLHFLVPVSLVLNVLLHGTSSLKIFAILALNYALARSLAGMRPYVLLVWAVNVGLLFLNELNNGYKYASLYEGLTWLVRIRLCCIRDLERRSHRTGGTAYSLAGTSSSTFPCSASSPSA